MLSIFLILLLFLSGSFFGAAILKKSAGRFIPITIMSIGMVLYIFGLFSALRAGLYFIFVIVFFTYLLSLYFIIRKRIQWNLFLKNFFTVPMILFFTFSAVSFLANYRKLIWGWDEFSHWADVVKAMVFLDDLATNESSQSLFKSYPPAMALVQYLGEKIYLMTKRTAVFSEWRLFFIWQVYAFSFIFPILESKKRVHEKISYFFAFLFTVTIYYSDIYDFTFIDPFIGILAGCGLTMVFFSTEKDRIYDVTVSLLCATLVLSKDVGLFFAIIIGICYALDRYHTFREKEGWLRNCLYSVIPLLALLLAKASWRIKLTHENVESSFSQRMNFAEYLRMFLFHKSTPPEYRQDVVDSVKNAFFSYSVDFGSVSVTYFSQLVLLLAILMVCTSILSRNVSTFPNYLKKTAIITAALQTVLYSVFIGAMYVYRFSEYEATGLASYSRYMNMVFLSLWIVTLSAVFRCMEYAHTITPAVIAACICIAVSPAGYIEDFISGDSMRTSLEVRKPYSFLQKQLETFCEKDAKIYFVCRSDGGYSILSMKFIARPRTVSASLGDRLFPDISAGEWMNTLLEEDYGYVAIYQLDDYFIQTFGECFENSEDLADNTVFYLDRENYILRKCE